MLVRSPTLRNSDSSVTVERLEAGEPQRRGDGRHLARRLALAGAGDRGDVLGRRAAAAAEQVDQAAAGELLEHRRGLVGRLVVLTEGVGQPGVGVAGHERVGDPGQLGDVGPHLGGAERAVEADRERPGVPHGVPERLGDLAGQGASGGVGDGAGDDHRPAAAALLEQRLEREDRGLGVERVEDRLDQQQVGAAVDQPVGLLEVGLDEPVVGDVALARVVDVRGDRRRSCSSGRARRSPSAAGPGSAAVTASQASRASRADSKLSS